MHLAYPLLPIAWLEPQRWIVLVVVAMAVVYVVRRVARAFGSKPADACSTCSGCPASVAGDEAERRRAEAPYQGCCSGPAAEGSGHPDSTPRADETQ